MISTKPLVAICLGYFLVILDVTAVSVAVPAIGTELGAGVTEPARSPLGTAPPVMMPPSASEVVS